MDMAVKEVENLVQIVPCFDGKELDIETDIVGNGLAAISIKHPHCGCGLTSDVIDTSSSSVDSNICVVGFKHRNSFWNLHRPELRKISWMQCCSPQSIQNIFQSHGYDKGEMFIAPILQEKTNVEKEELSGSEQHIEDHKCEQSSSNELPKDVTKEFTPLVRESPTFYTIPHPDTADVVEFSSNEADGSKLTNSDLYASHSFLETSENED